MTEVRGGGGTNLYQHKLLEFSLLLGLLASPLTFLVSDLCPPDPVLVVTGKASQLPVSSCRSSLGLDLPVDHNRNGQSEYEDTGEGAHPSYDLTEQRPGVHLVPHRGQSHQAPPERLDECPGLIDQESSRAEVLNILLCKVDEAGEDEEGDHDEEKEETQLL